MTSRKVGANNKRYSQGSLDAAVQQIRSGKISLRKASTKYNIPLGTKVKGHLHLKELKLKNNVKHYIGKILRIF